MAEQERALRTAASTSVEVHILYRPGTDAGLSAEARRPHRGVVTDTRSDTMFDAPSTPTRVPVRRRSWLLVSAAAAVGLAIAVAADDPGPNPDVARAAADEDAADRPLADRSDAPGASYDDHTLDLLQRLVDGGQIPRATLE